MLEGQSHGEIAKSIHACIVITVDIKWLQNKCLINSQYLYTRSDSALLTPLAIKVDSTVMPDHYVATQLKERLSNRESLLDNLCDFFFGEK